MILKLNGQKIGKLLPEEELSLKLPVGKYELSYKFSGSIANSSVFEIKNCYTKFSVELIPKLSGIKAELRY